MEYLIDKNGRRRKAEKSKCEFCNKLFLRRVYEKRLRKYCSPECFYKDSRKRTKLKCHTCGKAFERQISHLRNAKHGFFFCSRKCKEKAQSLNGNCPQIRPNHYGTSKKRRSCRNLINNAKNPRCLDCKENKKYLLITHHKDGNNNNSNKNNIEIVCGKCHMKRHLRLVNNEWIFDTKFLTPRKLLKKL